MEINSALELNYISYDIKSKCIRKITRDLINFYNSSMPNQLIITIKDYTAKDLSEQDTFLFGFSEKSFSSENKNVFISTIQNMIEKIEQSDNYDFCKKQKINIKDMENGLFEITYKEICAVVNIIINLFKSIPKKKKEKLFFNFYSKHEFPEIKLDMNGIKLQKIKANMDTVKQLNISISEKNNFVVKKRNEINLYVVKLFLLFFRTFFNNVLTLNIDLNIYEINNYFNKESNPYKIKESKIIKICTNFENIFLANLIIVKNLSKFKEVSTIYFFLYDSYQLEFYQIMSKYLNKNSETQNNIKENKENKENKEEPFPEFRSKLLYFDHLIQIEIKPFLDFNFDINALDPVLFLKTNLLIYQYRSVINTSINFFNFKNINLRKTLLNSYYFNQFLQEKETDKINPFPFKFNPDKINEIYENDYKLYYNHIDIMNNHNNKLLLKDEEIPNELFPYFNFNLNFLLFVLLKRFKSEKYQQNSLSFNFQTNNDSIPNLYSYNNYTYTILSFIFNLFITMEIIKKLENMFSLEIYLDDLSEKEYLIKNIFEKCRKNIPFDFKKNKLIIFKLDIPNITLFLPFENFPNENLDKLVIKNLTFNDLENIANTVKEKKIIFKKLTTIDISISFMLEDYKKYILILLEENIWDNLINFYLTIPCYIEFNDILDFLLSIKKNKNKSAYYYLKISNEELYNNLGKKFLDKTLTTFNKYKNEINERNLYLNVTCNNNKEINIKINLLNKENINKYLDIIFCFQKTYEKNIKNINNKLNSDKDRRKIFENIFYFMGNKEKKCKEVNIEVT